MQETKKTEMQVEGFIDFFNELIYVIDRYGDNMHNIAIKYFKQLDRMRNIVNTKRDCKWSDFTNDEKRSIEITVLYVTILYNMCKLPITKKSDHGLNMINKVAIKNMMDDVGKYIA